MSLPQAYVETTIPSFYHDVRTKSDVVARREWTRQWWDEATTRYELVTSEAVLEELALGIAEHSASRLSLVRDLPLLPVEPAVADIVKTYLAHKLMPGQPGCGCTAPCPGLVSQMRFSGHLELPAPRERE